MLHKPYRGVAALSIAMTIILFIIAGCGGGGDPKQPSDLSGRANSSSLCIGCHSTQISAGTGNQVTVEWTASVHNTASAAGCANCHKMATGHPNSCDECHGGGNPDNLNNFPINAVLTDPNSKSVCIDCHQDSATMWTTDAKHPDRANSRSRHFPAAAAVMDASYTASEHSGSNLTGNCRECHNPHLVNNTSQHLQWSTTLTITGPEGIITKAHSKPDSLAWANPAYGYQFRGVGTAQKDSDFAVDNCVRCHTTNGYIHYVTPASGAPFSDISPFTTDLAKRRQVLYCSACHSNASNRAYGFAIRAVPAVTGYYNFGGYTSSFTFPNLGNSNVCVSCHAGLVSGRTFKRTDPATVNFGATHANPGSAAGLLFQTIGYEFTGRPYGTPHGHTQLDAQHGPCLSCHTGNHTFRTFAYNPDGSVSGVNATTLCEGCHFKGSAVAITATTAEPLRTGYIAALAVLNSKLEKSGPTIKTSGWSSINNAGAWFNYKMLAGDPGGYAHAPSYVKRLIYDSIDWMDDGVLNNTVAATIASSGLDATTRARATVFIGTRP